MPMQNTNSNNQQFGESGNDDLVDVLRRIEPVGFDSHAPIDRTITPRFVSPPQLHGGMPSAKVLENVSNISGSLSQIPGSTDTTNLDEVNGYNMEMSDSGVASASTLLAPLALINTGVDSHTSFPINGTATSASGSSTNIHSTPLVTPCNAPFNGTVGFPPGFVNYAVPYHHLMSYNFIKNVRFGPKLPPSPVLDSPPTSASPLLQPLIKPPQQQLTLPQLETKEDTPDFNYLECSGGVIFDSNSHAFGSRYLVFWEYKNRLWRKSFLCNVYGVEGAKELAESFWCSKMRAIQLANRNSHARMLLPEPPTVRLKAPLERVVRPKAKRISISPKPSLQMISELREMDILDDPDVEYDAATNSWTFEYLDRATNEVRIKHIHPNGEMDIDAARKEATRQRSEHWQSLIREYSESKYHGLSYEKTRCCWRVAHWVPSKRLNRNKYFNISKYGYLVAKENGIKYRETVASLNGEEPQVWLPEQPPGLEFFQLPTTIFYHKVLNSLRSKDNRTKTTAIAAPTLLLGDDVAT